jgi:hypothetical protein
LPEDLTQTARAARGAYPAELLGRQQYSVGDTESAYSGHPYSPELHILDAEWYFTPSTSKMLADILLPGPICLLGTPTVANELRQQRYLLVDSSPFVLRRFSAVPAANLMNIRIDAQTRIGDFSSVLLDPPWYHPHLIDWLAVAFRAVGIGGRLLMPLIGEGTRPSASADRELILRTFSAAGSVEIIPDAVEYDIPLFEARALDVAGITLTAPWRRADLAIVEVAARPELPDLGSLPVDTDEGVWSTYVVRGQVVKLRAMDRARGGGPAIVPVPGVDGFVFDSVSRRDARRSAIDIWTSRNGVARVVDVTAVERMLTTLAAPDGTLDARIDTVRAESPDSADSFLRLLELSRD